MSLSIDELTTPLTEDQVFERFLATLETLNIPARSWRKAGAARTILRVVARTFSGFTEVMAAFIKSGFLETAEKSWLTLLARYVYDVERIEATFAAGSLRITNGGGGLYTFGAYEVVALWEAASKAYHNTEAFTLAPGETKLVAFSAVEKGSASSAPPGAITALETALPKVTVTNETSIVGTDEEQDAALRERCAARLDALSPDGPRGAYVYAVLSAKRLDGSAVDVNRVAVSPQSDTGQVTIYVASPSGAPTSTDLPIIAESADKVRPDTDKVTVLGAGQVPITRTFVVWARSSPGLSAEAVRTPVEAALVRYVSTYPIGGIPKPPALGGYLWADALKSIAQSAHPSIYDVDASDIDLALLPGQVAVLSAVVEVRLVAVRT